VIIGTVQLYRGWLPYSVTNTVAKMLWFCLGHASRGWKLVLHQTGIGDLIIIWPMGRGLCCMHPAGC